MADLRRVIAINRRRLPPARAEELSRQACEACALAAIRRAGRMVDEGHLRHPWAQVREALRCSRSPAVCVRILAFAARWGLGVGARGRALARTAPGP